MGSGGSLMANKEVTYKFKHITVITREAFDDKAMKSATFFAQKRLAALLLPLVRKTVRTWDKPPRFTAGFPTVRGTGGDYGAGIEIRVSGPNSGRWRDMDLGTMLVHVAFSDDFTPKTQPRIFDSFPGSGHITRKRTFPRLMWDARAWGTELVTIANLEFPDILEDEWNKALHKSAGGVRPGFG